MVRSLSVLVMAGVPRHFPQSFLFSFLSALLLEIQST